MTRRAFHQACHLRVIAGGENVLLRHSGPEGFFPDQPIPLRRWSAAAPLAVEVRLAQEIGTIIGLDASESGLALAEPEPEAEQPMAAERAEGAEPMVRSENTQVVRLDATDARPGDYSLTLVGEAGECTGDISVVGSEAEPALEEGGREDESGYGQ